MNTELLRIEIGHRRAKMAELLSTALVTTREIEQRLDFTGGFREAERQIDITTPGATCRLEVALLLRKARIHTAAVLRANETSNMHSLAVQMRPVLESAGQVVTSVHDHEIAPGLSATREQTAQVLGDRLNSDHYHWFLRRTKGGISAKELLRMETEAQEAAAAGAGAPKPKRNKSRKFLVVDRVRSLKGGPEWHAYLSEYFSHGRADWKGLSWRGGVMAIHRVENEIAFMVAMDYLAEQVGRMNAHAAWCHVPGDGDDHWDRWVEPTLAKLLDIRRESHALRRIETAEADRDARTD